MDNNDIAWDECIPDLPLDHNNLPPLNALSSASSEDLPQLELLDLFSFDNNSTDPHLPDHPPQKPSFRPDDLYAQLDVNAISAEKLSHCTSPPSDSSVTSQDLSTPSRSPDTNAHSTSTSPHHSSTAKPDSQADVLELNTRLASAGAETSALRKRVAALTAENRGLRAALDHANARLVAVAQAAAAHPPSSSPVVLGLAQVSSDVASRLAGALTVSDTTEDPRERKKRKRVAGAATTMACVMFMWGAMVGTPGLLKSGSGSYRSDGNLPAVWTSTDTAVAPAIPRLVDSARPAWQPNCMRVLKQLPDGSEDAKEEDVKEDVVKTEDVIAHDAPAHGKDAVNAMFVDMEDKEAANVVARSDMRERQDPEYSYVLCRDASAAIDSIKACAARMQRGESCGQPHTISLILPASAAGLEDNDTKSGMQPALAEVQCSVLSVARIPVNSASATKSSKYGRVIATVPEATGDMRQAK